MMRILVAGFAVLLVGYGMALAQGEPCTARVVEIVQQASQACETMDRNQACYGFRQIEAEPQPGVALDFNDTGDVASLSDLRRLTTTAYDEDSGQWGIALLKVQANLPDTVPGQNVTLVLVGNTSIEQSSDSPSPMQAFFFSTGVGRSACQAAADSLLIQSPQGYTTELVINGVSVEMASTLAFETTADGVMDILVIEGGATVATAEGQVAVPAGQQTQIQVEGDQPLGPPAEPVPFDVTRLASLPLGLLPNVQRVEATVPWNIIGPRLRQGDRVLIIAGGYTSTQCIESGCEFWQPDGQPYLCEPDDCAVPGAPYGVLVGRIGPQGTPFIVGAGGIFEVNTGGVLYLTVNDNRDFYYDNAGAYTVLVTRLE